MRRGLCAVPRWALTVFGLLAILLAVGATAIGFDNNPSWGPRRFGLVLLGTATLLMANLGPTESAARWLIRSLGRTGIVVRVLSMAKELRLRSTAGRGVRTAEPDSSKTPVRAFSLDLSRAAVLGARNTDKLQLVRFFAPVVALIAIIVVLYVWFITVGTWTGWQERTAYYDELARAFVQGQTSLLVEPDARLMELEDPYSLAQRQGIPFLWDSSYFEGKYYLYFGPTPGVLLAIVQLLGAGRIADLHIVFLADVAILLLSVWILVWIWRRHYAGRLPYWLLLICIAFVGVALPQLWVLGSRRVHEAAVSSGAALLLGALLAGLPFLHSGRGSSWRLAATGLLLALAVGARPSLLLPSAALTLLVAYRLARQGGPSGALSVKLLCLLLPLLLGGALMGWYNYDRFGDVLETGYRYQLTRREGSWQNVFDLRYLLPNLYNYLLNSYRTLPVFPYVKPKLGVESVPYIGVVYPHMYRPEIITGMALVAPAHVFAVFLAWWVVCAGAAFKPRSVCAAPSDEGVEAHSRLRWLAGALLVTAILGALPIGAYYWAANRFMLDFMPVLAIASCLGAWAAIDRYRAGSLERVAFPALVLVLLVVSIMMALLLGISGDSLRFEKENAELFEWLTRAFTW